MSNEWNTKVYEILETGKGTLEKRFGKNVNKSRFELLVLVVCSMILKRSACYMAIAEGMDTDCKESSNLRRLQSFMSGYELDMEFVGLLLLGLLPDKCRVRLSMDRTSWEFGGVKHNVLVVVVLTHGVSVPIWFECLDNKGGLSDMDDRCYVMMRCVELLGRDRIRSVVGDCEFIGKEWCKYLLSEGIEFYFDIRTNMCFTHKGRKYSVGEYMFIRAMKKTILDGVVVMGMELGLAMLAQKLKTGVKTGRGAKSVSGSKPILAVVTNGKACRALANYKNRWGIEVAFQCLKDRGFDLERSHVKDMARMRKLFAICSIALALCLLTGLEVDRMRQLPKKNHGYKANSFFRMGLDFIGMVSGKGAKKESIQKRLSEEMEAIIASIKAIVAQNILRI